MRATGNEGVAGLIQRSAGSIGYVGLEFARQLDLPIALLENKSGKFVKPGEQTCAAALSTVQFPENLRAFVPDPDGADSYPIATFSWILVRKNYNSAQTADAIKDLLQWSVRDGQRFASELGYVPLPAAVAEKSLAAIDTISGSTPR